MNLQDKIYRDRLFEYINTITPLTLSEFEELISLVSVEYYEKNSIVLNQGAYCQSIKFVLSGVFRNFQLYEGKEITDYFSYSLRNPIIASFTSLLTRTPSTSSIHCIEAGEVLSIPYHSWTKLYKYRSFNTLGRILAENNYLLATERIASLQFHRANDRYLAFISQYPELLNRIPHHYIASYLGITPESMSRLRKQIRN
ncbi:Crp/Fnr family transcriptional regulator [Tenacibaculum litopenaei]|uniref:Crp/Fnr family transcriptional regulator n=1 Tax=Tenacibaculum litopenaei TaxID=396016 RepID=UPI0038B61F4A